MIARAPIELAPGVYTKTCKVDNRALWDKPADLLRDTKAWLHIKKHQRTRYGRSDFLSLKDFYLGPNMVNEIALTAEDQITKVRYNGKSKHWTLDSYVAVHLDQH